MTTHCFNKGSLATSRLHTTLNGVYYHIPTHLPAANTMSVWLNFTTHSGSFDTAGQ